MLDEEQIITSLREKKAKLIDAYENMRTYRKKLRQVYLDRFPTLSDPRLETRLKTARAVPIEPFQKAVPLKKSFTDINEMKEWAASVLDGKVVVGVDGSQVYVTSDFNIPVGLARAGAFWVQYSSEQSTYGSDSLSEDYVGPGALENIEDGEPMHQINVDIKRLALEIELASRLVKKFTEAEVPTYLMMDTPLLLRYIHWAENKVKKAMCKTMTQLLDVCEQYHVPLVGYTDYSLARDLTPVIESFIQKEPTFQVSDAAIIAPLLEEAGFGSRTPAFQIHHRFLDTFYGRHRDEIGFFYQKVHSDLPVRIEFPRWVHRLGKIQELAEVIAAQTVLGEGYPYVLLRAHETAILEAEDREHFYAVVSWFLSEECGLSFRETAKAKLKRLSIA